METQLSAQSLAPKRRGRPKKVAQNFASDGDMAGVKDDPASQRLSINPIEGFMDIETAAKFMGNLPISTMYQLASRPLSPMPARKHGKRLVFYWPELKAWSDRENGLASVG